MPEPKLPLKLETCLSDLKNSLSEAFNTVRDDYMGYVWGEKQSDLATSLMGDFGWLMSDIRSRLDPSVRSFQVSNRALSKVMQRIIENLNDALARIDKKRQDQPEEKVYENYYIAVDAIKKKIKVTANDLQKYMNENDQTLEVKSMLPEENIIQPDN